MLNMTYDSAKRSLDNLKRHGDDALAAGDDDKFMRIGKLYHGKRDQFTNLGIIGGVDDHGNVFPPKTS